MITGYIFVLMKQKMMNSGFLKIDQSSVPILVCDHKFQQLESCKKKTNRKILKRTKNVVVDNKFISMNYMYSTKHTLYVYNV